MQNKCATLTLPYKCTIVCNQNYYYLWVVSCPPSSLRKGDFAINIFLSFMEFFPASLGVYLSSSFHLLETIRQIQKIQMLALCHGICGCLLGYIQTYWVPAKTSRSWETSCSSWFWSLLISVLIPHLHATWCCPVSPSFLYPPFQSDNTCWYPPCSLTLLYTYHLAYHLQTWLSFLCILKSTQTGLKALIWCYCDHNVIATPTYLNTLVQSQLDIGWASPFSVKLWPNSDPTWRLMVLTLRTA